jgi:hypothetical protein
MKIRISTRLVLVIGERAIKFPLGRRGYLQGKNEKDLYSRYAATGMLADLKWEWLGITCLQRCQLADALPEEAIIEIKKRIPELDIERCDLYNIDNWGTRDGRPVLIDYGVSEYISTLYR